MKAAHLEMDMNVVEFRRQNFLSSAFRLVRALLCLVDFLDNVHIVMLNAYFCFGFGGQSSDIDKLCIVRLLVRYFMIW